MKHALTLCLVLTLCCFIGRAQWNNNNIGQGCSAYCNTCLDINNFYTCKDCRSGFVYDSAAFTCTLNDTYYNKYSYLADSTLAPNDTSAPGCVNSGFTQFSTNGAIGNWTNATTINLFNELVPPHFKIRVIASVLCMDFCNSTKTLIKIDGVTQAQQDISTAKINNANTICNDNSRSEKYKVLDTTLKGHTLTTANTTVDLVTGGCQGGKICTYSLIEAMVLFQLCDQMCLTCFGTLSTQCNSCNNISGTVYWLTGTTCALDCPTGYYQNPLTPNKCGLCNSTGCISCDGDANNCTLCKTNYYFFNITANSTTPCVSNCTNGLYADTTTLYCQFCNSNCATCTGYPTPCQTCNDPYWLYMSDCILDCPAPYIKNADTTNRTCEDCNTYCIGLNMSFYKGKGTNGLSPLYVDMTFTHRLNFSTFDMTTFQTFSFSTPLYNIGLFKVNYTILSDYKYRITIVPSGFAFIVNETVTVTTMNMPDPKHTGLIGNPFKDEDYGVSSSLVWSYMKPPSMTDLQSNIVDGFASISTTINDATTAPGIQQFKKFGFFLLMFNSLQITSCLVLLNMILPQNLYEGIRFFASFIFFDVPAWEDESSKQRLAVVPPASNLTRRILTTKLSEFRFRRTGFTSMWLLDAYSQIFIIVVCYIVLFLVRYFCRKHKSLNRYHQYTQTALSNFHQICIMYFTLSVVFEFVYFDSTNALRYVSAILCIMVNLYYVGLHYYKYYDLLTYPEVALTSPEYEKYVLYYGHFLRNIRFEEYKTDDKERLCDPCRQWARPHNYHLLSYVKKVLMMLAFPIFYDYGFYQIVVLILLQFFEICRFVITWPFNTRWRNIFRLLLELSLFAVFIVVLIIQQVIIELMTGTASEQKATLYYTLGWVGFAFVMFFNFGFLVLTFLDWSRGCKYSNREQMDANRRKFYFDKLNQFEENNSDVPLDMLNQWVKKGNLNNRNLEGLPNVNVRIELYRIRLAEEGVYEVQINNVLEACMDTEFNFKKEANNIKPTRVFEVTAMVSPADDHILYKTIHSAYSGLANKKTSCVTIKTFSKVEQRKYKCGEAVELRLNRMYHEAEIDSGGVKSDTIEMEDLLPGFPIPETLLNKLVKNSSKGNHLQEPFSKSNMLQEKSRSGSRYV